MSDDRPSYRGWAARAWQELTRTEPGAQFSTGLSLAALLSIVYMSSVGLFSDDFAYILHQSRQDSLWAALKPADSFVSLIFEQYTHVFFLYFSSLESTGLLQLLKLFYVVACLYMCGRFFSLFMTSSLACVTAFLFIFFPTHESTVYWYLCQYLMLTISLYLYAYYLLERDRIQAAVLFAFMASFIGYGSPAPALAMTFLAWRKHGPKKAFLLVGPNVLYAVYYVTTSVLMDIGVQRMNVGAPTALLKLFLFQILTFLDATLGPSMWLKIIFSIAELTIGSMILTAMVVVLFKAMHPVKESLRNFMVDKDLLVAFGLMALAAFGMFAITGRYPNVAFGLGNRTNIFGAVLLAYVLVWAWSRTRYVAVALLAFMFAMAGSSDHWKKWSVVQTEAIGRIRGALEDNAHIDTLFVAGMQYSKMGEFDHIELFSEDWVLSSITALLTEGRVAAHPLNRNYELLADGRLNDVRYNERYEIPEGLYVLDFYDDELRLIQKDQLGDYISTLPRAKRHS